MPWEQKEKENRIKEARVTELNNVSGRPRKDVKEVRKGAMQIPEEECSRGKSRCKDPVAEAPAGIQGAGRSPTWLEEPAGRDWDREVVGGAEYVGSGPT